MKNKFLLALSVLLILIACNKSKLSPPPQTDIPDDVAFSTAERAGRSVNGMYALMKSSFFLGSRFLVYGDIRGEDFINRTNNGVTGLQTWNFTATPATNEVQYVWRDVYASINQANTVFERVDQSPLADATRAQYKAEARFVRAYGHLALLTLYAKPFADNAGNNAGIPLRLTAISNVGSNSLARSTVAEVYAAILQDLNAAETTLPLTYATPELNVTHAHRNTAIALKTRVYLAMGRWADVITEANKIVSATAPFMATTGVQHRLEPNVANVFTTYTTLESIFSMPFTTADLPGTQNGLASYYMPSPAGSLDYNLNPAGIIASTDWKATDARRGFVALSGTIPHLRKFAANPNTDFAPVIRYVEVLLNLAEARVRSTNTVDAQAVALLNAVRQRSDPSTTYTVASFATPNDLINQILLERRIELIGEGFRNFDIMRTLQTFPVKGAVPVIPPSAFVYIWPIPQSELFANPLATQNNGY